MTSHTPLSFFFDAIKNRAYTKKRFIVKMISVTLDDGDYQKWDIVHRDDGVHYHDGEQLVKFEGVVPHEPVINLHRRVTMPALTFPEQTQPMEITPGQVLFQAIAIQATFNGRWDVRPGYVDLKKLEAEILAKVKDDPVDGKIPDDGGLYISDYRKFIRNTSSLVGITGIVAPGASEGIFTVPPEVGVRKAELLEKHKDKLHDPAIQAEIQDELIAIYRKSIAEDPANDFFVLNPYKSFDTALKRMLLIHGPEAGFNEGGNARLITNSLEDGWSTDGQDRVAMFNSLRAGSYFRGALTAQAGESVKFMIRIFQNSRVVAGDCGTKLGIPYLLNPVYKSRLVGQYVLDKNDKPVKLTSELFDQYAGKYLIFRSPGRCLTPGSDFCEVCGGDILRLNPLATGAMCTDYTGVMFDAMMASAHAKAAKTAKLNFKTFLENCTYVQTQKALRV